MRRRVSLQSGIGLVELMVSMALGLLLTTGVFQVYLATRQSARLEDALARRQETLRYATLLLTHDLRLAGYHGCLPPGAAVDSGLAAHGHLYDFAVPVQGFDANGTGWTPALDASVGTVAPGTDVLTVRGATEPALYTTAPLDDPAGDVAVGRRLASTVLAPAGGNILLISDCSGAEVFESTAYDPAQGRIAHVASFGPPPQNAANDAAAAAHTLHRRFAAGAEVSNLLTTSYFIRSSASGVGLALWRRAGAAASEELAEGVENLQVEYGEDLDGDRAPDRFSAAGAVGDWGRVCALRVALLAASPPGVLDAPDPRRFTLLGTPVGPFADRRLRHAVTLTVALRNSAA